jgi:photosynthetic reaction center H subunit
MPTGAITEYIDVAQIVLYVFWGFFAALILYLRGEDKREGYPLESDRSDRSSRVKVVGFPGIPKPKTFKLRTGDTVVKPDFRRETRALRATPVAGYPGAPLVPTGNPMLDGVGPGSWAERATVPDITYDGRPKIVPLRVATHHSIPPEDPDPRGYPVLGADGVIGATVRDIWVDRSEELIRYYEIEVAGGRRVLVPSNLARVSGRKRTLTVVSILGSQFAQAPGLSNPDQVTLREEDQACAYYAGGKLYATAARQEPLL